MGKTHTYFLSDAHLGVDLRLSSLEREKKLVRWLDAIAINAKAIYLVGDIFDHWYEYKKVVPKGFVRLLGALARMADSGTEITFIKGNHDMWVYDYFEKEIGIHTQQDNSRYTIDGKVWHITHGDGLDPNDKKYLLIKGLLRNRISQTLYSLVPPRIGLPLMKRMSNHSRDHHDQDTNLIHRVMQEAGKHLFDKAPFDFFICGHLHAPILTEVSEGYTYCNLGDWMTHFTYGVWDGHQLKLKKYEGD